MDAVKFLKEKKRMCDRYYSTDCKGCPLEPAPENGGYASCDQFEEEDPEEVVLNVEEWSNENPIITNAMKFEEVFGTLVPVAKLINNNPTWWDKEYEAPVSIEMTNGEKFKEVFGYEGSTVSKVLPSTLMYDTKGSCGYEHCSESCGSRYFPRCPKWWNDTFGKKEY